MPDSSVLLMHANVVLNFMHNVLITILWIDRVSWMSWSVRSSSG